MNTTNTNSAVVISRNNLLGTHENLLATRGANADNVGIQLIARTRITEITVTNSFVVYRNGSLVAMSVDIDEAAEAYNNAEHLAQSEEEVLEIAVEG